MEEGRSLPGNVLAHTVLDGGIGLGQGRSSATSIPVSIQEDSSLTLGLILITCMVHVMFGTCNVWECGRADGSGES